LGAASSPRPGDELEAGLHGDLDCGIVTAQPVAAAQEEVIALGALLVDPAGRRVTVKGTEVSLARKEFALLLALAAQPDRVFSKEELLATVWGTPA
jgi:DNA-binding response OmpR family regulator